MMINNINHLKVKSLACIYCGSEVVAREIFAVNFVRLQCLICRRKQLILKSEFNEFLEFVDIKKRSYQEMLHNF